MQQAYAGVSGVVESIEIADLVEDALRLNTAALMRHQVKIIRKYEDNPHVTVEKHKVLQIFMNLISNAKYAFSESRDEDKQMTVRIYGHGQDRVRIEIIDNGVGISRKNMVQIFSHGFTTRKEGHGFGLHSSSLAAKDLNGSLTVHSEGAGKGACFTLDLPIHPNPLEVSK